MTHTPGPWLLQGGDDGGFLIEAEGPPRVLCTRAPWPSRAEESAANGRLIAAAPDLLKALRHFLADERFQVAVGGNPNAVEAMLAEARAALRAAGHEPPR